MIQVQEAAEETNQAKREAQVAFDKASETRNLTEANKKMLTDLLDKITDFLQEGGATPADIRSVRGVITFFSESICQKNNKKKYDYSTQFLSSKHKKKWKHSFPEEGWRLVLLEPALMRPQDKRWELKFQKCSAEIKKTAKKYIYIKRIKKKDENEVTALNSVVFVAQVANEVLEMKIKLTPEEIRDLARQINETIRDLTDIETILEDTKEDLDKAQRLKERADSAKYVFEKPHAEICSQ